MNVRTVSDGYEFRQRLHRGGRFGSSYGYQGGGGKGKFGAGRNSNHGYGVATTPGIRHTITESPFRSYPDLQDTGDGRPPASHSVSIGSGPPGR